MKRIAQFNRIFIIQSLEEGLTGKRLYDDLNTLTICKDHPVRVELHDVITKLELLSLLDSIPQRMNSENLSPILHFEVHGSVKHDGIILSSADLVSWAELKTPLIAINIASQFNLIVCFAACHGAWFIKALTPNDRSPCWAMIGPAQAIDESSLLADFTEMYTCILNGKTGDEAIKVLNRSLPAMQAQYFFTTAETFFCQIWDAYMKKQCTPEANLNRANDMISELRINKKIPRTPLPDPKEVMKSFEYVIRPMVKAESMKIFFMTDLFPKNIERFSLDKKKFNRTTD